jgi:glycosyltransferase involved in cell wall biosynthesis
VKIEAPFFSIVLVVPDSYHLAPVTLSSFQEQTFQDFEVILVEHGLSERDIEILKHSCEQIVKIYPSYVQSHARLMNKGLGFARGRYVLFFFPGDVFLSKHVLFELKKKIEENHFPQLVSSGYIDREEEKAGELMCYPPSLELLKKGQMPTRLPSICFLRSVLEEVHGFDKHYPYRGDFEMLCRLLKNRKREQLYLPRIFVDYVFRRRSTKEFLGEEWETMRILFRHFGFLKVFLWLFFQDHFHLVKWWFKSVKQSFFRRA